MKEYFIYDDKAYDSEDDVNEAIIEKIGHNYNNIDVTQTSEFELEAQTIKTVMVDEVVDLMFKKSKYTTVEPTTLIDRIVEQELKEKEMNENKDFKRFKRWCMLKGLKPGNATSLQLYMKRR